MSRHYKLYCQSLDLKSGSLLTPDIGGAIYYSNLRIYDLGGLIDKRYALVGRGKNNPELWNLIFDQDKPSFINIHSNASYDMELFQDSRLNRDYHPITETSSILYNKPIVSGIYIRKELFTKKLDLNKMLVFEAEDMNSNFDKKNKIINDPTEYSNKCISISAKENKKDFLIFRPYISLDSGKYQVEFVMKVNDFTNENDYAGNIEVVSGLGTKVHSSIGAQNNAFKSNDFISKSFDVDLETKTDNIEFRFFYNCNSRVSINRIKVTPYLH
jgi:hypothetical protein